MDPETHYIIVITSLTPEKLAEKSVDDIIKSYSDAGFTIVETREVSNLSKDDLDTLVAKYIATDISDDTKSTIVALCLQTMDEHDDCEILLESLLKTSGDNIADEIVRKIYANGSFLALLIKSSKNHIAKYMMFNLEQNFKNEDPQIAAFLIKESMYQLMDIEYRRKRINDFYDFWFGEDDGFTVEI